MNIQVDYSEVTARSVQELPEGQYPVHIFKWEMKEGNNGSKYIVWHLKIFNNQAFGGRFVFYQTALSGPYAWTLQKLLAAANPAYNAAEPEFDPDQYLGLAVEVRVAYKPGKKYPDVKGVFPYVENGSVPTYGVEDVPF